MWWLWVGCTGFSDYAKDPGTVAEDTAEVDSSGAVDDSDASPSSETGLAPDTGDSDAVPSAAPLWLTFQQLVRFGDDFLAKGTHELWIGPDDGSGPPAAGWTRVLDGPAMASDFVPDAWWRRTLDVGPEVAALGTTSFAVAFRYAATGADSWYLDEVCVSSTGGTGLLDCDALYADFEGIAVGALPGEARVVRLPGDGQGEDAWGATTNAGPASQGARSMTISYSSDPQDQALVLSSYPNGPWP